MRTSFHHQPEAQHPKSSAIHKLPADYPIYRGRFAQHMLGVRFSQFGPQAEVISSMGPPFDPVGGTR
jgi:hypothetical protein